MTQPQPSNPAAAPDTGGVMRSVIPTGNKPALIGYYCGVFSLIAPLTVIRGLDMIVVLGIPLGLLAFVLGMAGLRKVRQQPSAKGTAHAWVAILLGLVSAFSSAAGYFWLTNMK